MNPHSPTTPAPVAQAPLTPATPAAPASEWRAAVSEGRTYYWHTVTREVTWTRPASLGGLSSPSAAALAQPVVVEPPEDVSPYVAQAKLDNAVMLEHYLLTFGWNSRWVSKEMIRASVEGAKGSRLAEHPVVQSLVDANKESLARELRELEESALAAELKLKKTQEDAERARQLAVPVTQKEADRIKLLDFLTRCTSVHRDKERVSRMETVKAKVEKRARDRELTEVTRGLVRFSDRPRREGKSRIIEQGGYMILKENNYSMDEGMITISGSMPVRKKSSRSAFSFYAKDANALVRKESPGMDFTAIQREVARRWRLMSEEEKAPFNQAALDDKLNLQRLKEQDAQMIVQARTARLGTPGGEARSPAPGSQQADGGDSATAAAGSADAVTPMADEDSQPADDEDSLVPTGSMTPALSDVPMSSSAIANVSGSGGPPRPVISNLIIAALLAIGPRAGVTLQEITRWVQTTPVGTRLTERVKVLVDPASLQKQLRKLERQGVVQFKDRSLEFVSVLSPASMKDMENHEPLARMKRRRRNERQQTGEGADAAAKPVSTRMEHNNRIKEDVIQAALFRWAYAVRNQAVIEPFIGSSAKVRLAQAAELLTSNELGFLIDPKLDQDDVALAEAITRAKRQLCKTPEEAEKIAAISPLFGRQPATLPPQPPTIVNGEMREYQRRGLGWLASMFQNGVNAVLADEMGLGKTLQTISFLAYLKDVVHVSGPYIVVVPLSVLTNWCNELRKWCPTMRVIKLHSSSREERERIKRDVLTDFDSFDVVVTTYEMVTSSNMKAVLTSKLWWRVVVIDEGHKIKNDETGLSQAMRSMNGQYRLLLSGTPLQNNLHELWAMLNFLDPVLFESSAVFDSCFDLAKDKVDRTMLEKAHYLMKPFSLRRTKGEVESMLPRKDEIEVKVPLSEMQAFWYKRLILQDAALLDRVETSVTANGDAAAAAAAAAAADEDERKSANDWKRLQSLMMQLRKCCNHPYLFDGAEPDFDGTTSDEIVSSSGKLKTLDLMLKKLKDKGHRVVIFSQFTSMLDILNDFLKMRGYKFSRLDGATNRVQRAVDIMQYNQDDSQHFAYLMSTRAGGLGINLATADTVILYDSDWNPQVDLQAMDRVHRIGQNKTVHVYRLVTAGTIEERIVQRAKKKLFLDRMVNRGSTAQSEALESLSKAEMLKMLKFGASAVFGGQKTGYLTDAELDQMIDRSERSACNTPAPDGSGGGGGGASGEMNALDFDATQQAVSIRELYGQEFARTVESATPEPDGNGRATPKRKRRNADEVTTGTSPAPQSVAATIAEEWRSANGIVTGATKSGRKVKSRYTQVDGHTVLNANNYTLEEGERSVFDQELSKRHRGMGQASLEQINRALGRGRQIAGRDYDNETHCLRCWDGGDLLLCDQCPVSMHAACMLPDQRPVKRAGGTPPWGCPHHSCKMCERKSAAAGGMLFRCSECPSAYCEEHLPQQNMRLNEGGRCERFEELGYRKPTQGYYIQCSEACQLFFQQREQFGVEEAIRLAQERLAAEDVTLTQDAAGAAANMSEEPDEGSDSEFNSDDEQ